MNIRTLFDLPPDILREIFAKASNNQRAKICRRSHALFQQPRNINRLMQYVMREEQDKAENFILTIAATNLPFLFRGTSTITDDMGRRFDTPFQHTLWSKDWQMWEMLRKYMTNEEVATQLQAFKTDCNIPAVIERNALIQALSLEYINLFETWSVEQRRITRAHILALVRADTNHGMSYDNIPLDSAYQRFITQSDHWNDQLFSDYLCEVIGFFQSLMPRFLLHESFCRPERSNNPRATTSIGVYLKTYYSNLGEDLLPPRTENIYPLAQHKGLGVTYALVRDQIESGPLGFAWRGNCETPGWNATRVKSRLINDRKRIAELCETGARKFQALEQALLPLPLQRCPTDNTIEEIEDSRSQEQRFMASTP